MNFSYKTLSLHVDMLSNSDVVRPKHLCNAIPSFSFCNLFNS